jgi:y4mF family transcriptional regulator
LSCFPAKNHYTFPLGNIMFKHYITPAEIGAAVRSARKAQKLRQDQLAGVANVGLRFIVDLEAGKPTAQIGKVLTVLAALGVTIEMKTPEARDG